jgi:hypothetical protein
MRQLIRTLCGGTCVYSRSRCNPYAHTSSRCQGFLALLQVLGKVAPEATLYKDQANNHSPEELLLESYVEFLMDEEVPIEYLNQSFLNENKILSNVAEKYNQSVKEQPSHTELLELQRNSMNFSNNDQNNVNNFDEILQKNVEISIKNNLKNEINSDNNSSDGSNRHSLKLDINSLESGIYMYICMFIHIYVYIDIDTYIYIIYVYIIYIYIYIYVYIYVYTYIYKHMFTHTYVYKYIHIYRYFYICIHMYTYICI